MSENWGHIVMTLSQTMRKKGVDQEKLAFLANVQKKQLMLYINNEVKRPDLHVLARICAALGCDIGEVMRYIPGEKTMRSRTVTTMDDEIRYTTGRIAKEIAVHPNTVRFYEKIGLISPAERLANNYRSFTSKHLVQLRICRIIFDDPYTNSTLRNAAFAVVSALKEGEAEKALENVRVYQRLIEKEYAAALETAALLKNWTEERRSLESRGHYSHKEAATMLGITPEVLRNWERNGLIRVPRSKENNARVYGSAEIARLRVIYMLRQNHYSIAAIQRSLSFFDSGNRTGAVLALQQPDIDAEIEYVNAGDHWLDVLTTMSASAKKIERIVVAALKKGYSGTPPGL